MAKIIPDSVWVVWVNDQHDEISILWLHIFEDDAFAEVDEFIEMQTYSLPTDIPVDNEPIDESAWECDGVGQWWEEEKAYVHSIFLANGNSIEAYAQQYMNIEDKNVIYKIHNNTQT